MAFEKTLEDLRNLDIGDLNWERIGVWPMAGRAFLWLLAVAIIIGGAYWFFVKDLNASLIASENKEKDLRATFETKAKQSALLEAYQQQMADIQKQLEDLRSQLPDQTDVPELLEDIDEKGVASGLDIDSIKVLGEQRTDFYVELPIDIIVKGSYHDLGTFVSGIAGMERIVTLHDFKISKKTEDAYSNLEMSIQAKTYRILDEEASSTQGAK